MSPANVNWFAVVAAALSTFIIGSLWYSFLFAKAWMKASGMTTEKAQASNMVKTFGFAFLFSLIAAANLGFFLADPSITAANGALYGFLTGFGWVAMAIGVMSQFEQRSWSYILIHSGYWIVSFTVMGLILGLWK